MSNPDQNTEQTKQPSQRSRWRLWINRRSLIIGGFSYIAGFATLPLAVLLWANTPEVRKEKFLEGVLRDCPGCDLSNEDLSFAELEEANLSKANLEGAILGAAKLSSANLSGANLRFAVLRQAELHNTVFDGADLTSAEFRCGAGTCTRLSGTSFRNANLTRADFRVVGFTPVGEEGLEGVDFTGADLTEATFEGASLRGALMEQAKFCRTIMPDGSLSNRDCEAE